MPTSHKIIIVHHGQVWMGIMHLLFVCELENHTVLFKYVSSAMHLSGWLRGFPFDQFLNLQRMDRETHLCRTIV